MLLTEKKPRLKCDLAFAKCMYIVFSLLTFFYVNDEKFQKLILPTPQSEIQRKAELIMREEVLQGFEEQRVLVDALTNVSIHLGYFSFKFNLSWFLWPRSAMIPNLNG